MAGRQVSPPPVEVHSVAPRLSADERARIEAMGAAGVSAREKARRLGRHRSMIYREPDNAKRFVTSLLGKAMVYGTHTFSLDINSDSSL